MKGFNMTTQTKFDYYECGICSAYHKWGFNGDCRDDSNRFSDIPDNAQVACMHERVEADGVDLFDRCEMCGTMPETAQ